MLDQVVIKHEKLFVINVVPIQYFQSNTNKFTPASVVMRSIMHSFLENQASFGNIVKYLSWDLGIKKGSSQVKPFHRTLFFPKKPTFQISKVIRTTIHVHLK